MAKRALRVRIEASASSQHPGVQQEAGEGLEVRDKESRAHCALQTIEENRPGKTRPASQVSQ